MWRSRTNLLVGFGPALFRTRAAPAAAATATVTRKARLTQLRPLYRLPPQLLAPARRVPHIASCSAYSTEATDKAKPVQREFQAETRKLLQIVAKSLYSEKEVFVRELISNASDALEKLRHRQVMNESFLETDTPLQIHLTTNEADNTLTISDTGIGMKEEELIKNLGTIAHSGSKAFLEDLSKSDKPSDSKDNIIGQFGVGFYSAFMVADRITVETRSALGDAPGYQWSSDGSGTYDITPLDDTVPRGTKIVLHLKEANKNFAQKHVIEEIIQKYSNFVGFPIHLNGERINTLQPLWMMKKDDVTQEQHSSFYKYISKSSDDPQFTLHYSADAPISLRSVLYIPKRNEERMAMARSEPGVSLYARKVLIQSKCRALLPEWLRFLKGVCDSEDIPLNLSREMLQDSALINKLKTVLTGRVIKWLNDEASKDHDAYLVFYREFGGFLKEGACIDNVHKDKIAKLLRFQSSYEAPAKEEEGEEEAKAEGDKKKKAANKFNLNDSPAMTSLQDYVDRMKPDQKGIYFFTAPSREAALASAYFEPFKQQGTEVLFLMDPVDEIALGHLRSFNDKDFINIDSEFSDVHVEIPPSGLTEKESGELIDWMKTLLAKSVVDIKVSKRLVSHPAMIVGHESMSTRNIMRMMEPNFAAMMKDHATHKLELNPSHPIIIGLAKARVDNPKVAEVVARQVLDSALIAAGAMDDPRTMLVQLNELMQFALKQDHGETHAEPKQQEQEQEHKQA